MSEPKSRSLQPLREVSDVAPVKWNDRSGTEHSLSIADVRALFPSRHAYTNGEMLIFLQKCRSAGADPFAGDLYLIKYSANDKAQHVTGYHFFMALAKENPNYDNFELWYVDAQGKRIPDGLEDDKKVVAAVCQVYHKGSARPVKFVARATEFVKKNRPDPNHPWNAMRVHMLGKCAIGNAHRWADPARMRGMILQEEVGQEYAEDEQAVEAEYTEVPDAAPEEGPAPEPEPEEEAPVGEGDTCPECGEGTMTLRKGKRGPFLGCSRFRQGCKHTTDVPDKPTQDAPGEEQPPEEVSEDQDPPNDDPAGTEDPWADATPAPTTITPEDTVKDLSDGEVLSNLKDYLTKKVLFPTMTEAKDWAVATLAKPIATPKAILTLQPEDHRTLLIAALKL